MVPFKFILIFASETIKLDIIMGILVLILVVALFVAILLLWYMRTAVKVAQRAERMNLAFLQNISHEIRVPLKAISTLAKTVAENNLYLSKNEKQNISEQMQYNSSLIATLLDEVMMFTDCDDGHPLKMESISPNALCRRCLEANQHSIYHRQAVKLNFIHELSDEFFIKSDCHLVELIISKLVINSCKFTEIGEINVGCSTQETPGRLTIYVSDTGVGIPEHRLGSIFTYFEKPDDIKDEAELDLSICHRLAEKLGGQLIRDSRYTNGTRIKLELPLR